mmetsp:Transcript_35687/g.43028  ORF Transcript_35687/g.43028 Transcript_35687/m.43028 type:complete len:212 (+) Transcript_35687:80-715(+)|eukprot:CAMPEP_0197845952 /NCGR_PEP_ID=MMETSP1438-20131217/2800_1 /TAXON_ID=1461541 /ORGANISM="Pterosperma sp., Strain CCMP1384" /LENGTH=211 /DNA_ID=CAMNT_0043457433 /DNA_START=84 /DNA_END=719 /DNA_ORIENTATION=-
MTFQMRVYGVLVLSLLAITGCMGLEFDLLDRSNTKEPSAKCVLEEMNSNVLALLDFESVDGTPISVKLEDPFGTVLWTSEDTPKGQYGFTTKTKGDFKVCFTRTDPTVDHTSHKIRLDWKTGVAASDWDNLASKEHMEIMAFTLRELETEITRIHEGMLYMRSREAEMRDLSESTNARVAWLSVLSLSTCILLSVWQVFYLKNFFMRKKLL